MKKIFLIIFLLASLSVFSQIDKIVPAKPPVSAGFVHDFAGLLTDEQEQSIEDKLNVYDASTSNQIAIVTLSTLLDKQTGTQYEDEEVALKILRDWGVGQKDRNNGIVILIVKSSDDKERKIRIFNSFMERNLYNEQIKSEMKFETLLTVIQDGIFYITINRQSNHNCQGS